MLSMSETCWIILPLTCKILTRCEIGLWWLFTLFTLFLYKSVFKWHGIPSNFKQYPFSSCCLNSGILPSWRFLSIPCEFSCKRWIRLQAHGRNGIAAWQTKSPGMPPVCKYLLVINTSSQYWLIIPPDLVFILGGFSHGISFLKMEALRSKQTSSCKGTICFLFVC